MCHHISKFCYVSEKRYFDNILMPKQMFSLHILSTTKLKQISLRHGCLQPLHMQSTHVVLHDCIRSPEAGIQFLLRNKNFISALQLSIQSCSTTCVDYICSGYRHPCFTLLFFRRQKGTPVCVFESANRHPPPATFFSERQIILFKKVT